MPVGFNLLEVVKSNWISLDNVLNVDFELYASYAEAIAPGTSGRWTVCNYNDPPVGFPRDCGPYGLVPYQWNDFTRTAGRNAVFYIEGTLEESESDPLKIEVLGTLLDLHGPISYCGTQDLIGSATVFDDGTFEMSGNAWKAFPFEHDVTFGTAISFTFSLAKEAEFHLICLDTNSDQKDNNRCFQIAGLDSTVRKMTPRTLEGTSNHYVIHVGNYFTGKVNFLTFVQNNDHYPTVGYSSFRDIVLFDVTRNLALRKPTSQSSTSENGNSEKAVDGNRDGDIAVGSSVAMTEASDLPSWWEVNLEGAFKVKTVTLFNSIENSVNLSNVIVKLLNANDITLRTSQYIGSTNGVQKVDIDFKKYNGLVSKVRVVLPTAFVSLQLAEVEVFEEASPHRQFMGCFKDSLDRGLPHKIVLNGNSQDISYSECATACWNEGYIYFGRQHYEECFCGGLEKSDVSFSKHGTATGCDCDGNYIGYWKSCVYKFLDSSSLPSDGPDSSEYEQVCDNGLVPGDVVVTAFNTDTNFSAKPVVVVKTMKDLKTGDEFYMTDRALDCSSGPCTFAPFADSYHDGTVKFTAYELIPAGNAIAFSKHKKPYSSIDYYFIKGNKQYSDGWSQVSWDGVADDNQFHLYSMRDDMDSTSKKILTGDNIILYCMAGSVPVYLFSVLWNDNPDFGWAGPGDLWGGDLSEEASKRSYKPPYGPALLLNPSTVPNEIKRNDVICACDNLGEESPLNTYSCNDGSTGSCYSHYQCYSDYFSKKEIDDACGADGLANNWKYRNHYFLSEPECGSTPTEFAAHAVDGSNWNYKRSHKNYPRITSVVVTDPYRFFCEGPPDRRKNAVHEEKQQLIVQEAVREYEFVLQEYHMEVKLEELASFEYLKTVNEYNNRRSKYLPDGKTPIPGNEAPQTQAIDPRVPVCFGNPMCKLAKEHLFVPGEEQGAGSGENQIFKKFHPLGNDAGIGTF
eukprot:CAMPEP_0195517696 /NCGR_PEP_ID=MMETSP0794_2-20130614/11341_1 /TAXON_ID=515487 /ORGANISM="Stephanopyxis turris, Strain CCMP 815" /LENGTH=962 /DNA_ID=CAMNT_0040646555 /DNA_START=421 /DNA_END=3309 /DNA_ORIENTATION=+